jgi:hypothetical protein
MTTRCCVGAWSYSREASISGGSVARRTFADVMAEVMLTRSTDATVLYACRDGYPADLCGLAGARDGIPARAGICMLSGRR